MTSSENIVNQPSSSFTIDEYTRWLCLLEAIALIDAKAQDLKTDLDDTDWIKPLAIQKYIVERFPSMKHDIAIEFNCTPDQTHIVIATN